MHLAQILVIHMALERQRGMGRCLSFQPWEANMVAKYPTTRDNPNNTNLNRARGTVTTSFTKP